MKGRFIWQRNFSFRPPRENTGWQGKPFQGLRAGWRQGLFRDLREKIPDGLYDHPRRPLRFVPVRAEMFSIPGEKMRRLASLCRGEHRTVLLRKRKPAPLSRPIRNKADCPEHPGQPAKGRGSLPFQVQPRLCQAIRAGHNLPMTPRGQFDDKGRLPFRVMGGCEQHVRVKKKTDQRLRPNFFTILDRSPGESRSSRSHRAISSSV